ncbi:ATP-grasp domain-containing protein [Tomitella gaofuii]|uniref:ATP-grasp domain-containing protein n=1 Tax=Tomitella gaofuii TaxID=2760083 RepID=UPI001F33765E|nr:ATP-grasp domain-containing protein [Tomitella gaofuii]
MSASDRASAAASAMSAETPKRVLVTFGRSFLSLSIARLLGSAGHTVHVADAVPFAVSRFSNRVARMHRTPRPKYEPLEWAFAIAGIVREQKIDLLVTVHEETDILAQVIMRYPDLFPDSCRLLLSDFELEHSMHNKYEYQQLLDSIGVPTLRYALVRSQEDLDALDFDFTFALKQVFSRGAQDIHKVHPDAKPRDLSFNPANPWIAQEWLSGDKYCSYSICHNGKVYADALYPVHYAIDGHSCLSYEQVEHEGIAEWIRQRVKELNFTGQVGFDFIDNPERGLFTIECNPRATSGVMLFEPEDRVDRAFLGENDEVIRPRPGVAKMLGPGMAMYGWRKSSLEGNTLRGFLRDFRRTDEVITQRDDLGPAFGVPLAVGNILAQAVRYRVNVPEAFMYENEWDGRPLPT